MEPTDVGATSVVLGMDILRFKLTQRHLIAPKERTALAVGIIFPRASTVILDVGEIGRNTHTHSELRHYGFVGACRLVVDINLNSALVDDRIFHRNVSNEK